MRRIFLFFGHLEPGDSYKRDSYKKKPAVMIVVYDTIQVNFDASLFHYRHFGHIVSSSWHICI